MRLHFEKSSSDLYFFWTDVQTVDPHIVSILLTGFSETQEVIKTVGAGIFSYILKPRDSDYLIAEVPGRAPTAGGGTFFGHQRAPAAHLF